jgi:polyisoprenyl-phosphate glycosyltransferase
VLLSVVVAVYRSEPCLRVLASELRSALDPTGWEYEVILVNDYSPDESWRVIEFICAADPRFIGVDLRRNFGQDNAILTGLRLARGSLVAVMDDDLQHDPGDLPRLVEHFTEGIDVVYAHFATKHQKLWKNVGSWVHGKIADWVLSKPSHIYLSPYKVIRREVVELVCRYQGPTPYIDGLLFQATWRTASVPAQHHRRIAGKGNYNLWRAAGVTARMVFSFSARPVRLIVVFGAALTALSLIAAVVLIGVRTRWPESVPNDHLGWVVATIAAFLSGGLQIMFTGFIGEYTGRIYLRVNRKPQTSIRRILNGSSETPFPHEVTNGVNADI